MRARRFFGRWLLGLLLAGSAMPVHAQVTLYVSFGASINSYNATTGAFVSQLATSLSNPWALTVDSTGRLYSSLYSGDNVAVFQTYPGGGSLLDDTLLGLGMGYATGLAVQGNLLYVASQHSQRVSLFNATTGALINASFISNVYNPTYLILDGNGRLFVTNNNSVVSVFDAATGASLSPNFITGLSTPMGLALDANNRLYVASTHGNTVAVYNATSGALINPSLIAGLTNPRALAFDPSGNLYVSSFSSGNGYYVVGRYDPLTGAALNSTLLVAGSSIGGIGFAAVPEPATWANILLGLAIVGAGAWWKRRS